MSSLPMSSRLAAILIAVPLCGAASEPPSAGWYPSRYGADDRLGALNNLSPAKAAEAARLVKDGRVYSLAVVTSASTPTGANRSYQVEAYPLFPGTIGANALSGMDDKVTMHLGVGTQVDGMGHVGIGQRHYNGVPASEMLREGRLTVFGMQGFPPVVTRGVLLDIASLRGVQRLPGGTRINRDDIEAAMKRQGVRITKGDVVLLHTGWLGMASEQGADFLASEPGLGVEGARYLADLGVVAVGADNHSLEHVPFADPQRPYEVHQVLLPENGVYILEFVHTEELARDSVHEFMFVLAAPRLDGTVQSVVHPVAIR
jgi:kynurenine formamidase